MTESKPDYELFDDITDRKLMRDALERLDPVLIAIVCIVAFCDSVALGAIGIAGVILYPKLKYLGYSHGPPTWSSETQEASQSRDESSGLPAN